MAQGTNPEHTRAYNRRAVLQALRLKGAASRTEVAQQTSLSLQAVSNIMGSLVDEGLVLQGERRSTVRGQPPIDFTLNPNGAYALGFSIDKDHLLGVLINFAGEIIRERHLELESSTPAEAFGYIQSLVRDFTKDLPHQFRQRIHGVGLSLPGLIEEEGGRVLKMVRLPQWEGLKVGKALTDLLGLPVYVANDATSAALGELWYGHGRSSPNFFYILFALGLGSSLILDGAPYRGVWGVSGRMGHIPVEPEGRVCLSCGETGCLSLYTSLEALVESLRKHGISVEQVSQLEALYHEQNPYVLEWLDTAAHYLTRGLVVLENLLDPDAFIFGGFLPRPLLNHLVSKIKERYSQRRIRLRQQNPDFLAAHRGTDATAFGAATLPIYLRVAPDYELVLAG